MTTEPLTITDPAVMRALAHPKRLELLEVLNQRPDGATATEAAAVIGLSPSATSYHLRALARVSMISEAPSRGDGRERVWRSNGSSFEVDTELVATPEQAEAERALVEAYLARGNERVRRYLARARTEPPEWHDSSFITDYAVMITPDELKRLVTAINDLVEPLKASKRTDVPEGARRIIVQLRVVPDI